MAQICYKNLKLFSWYFLCANIFVCVVIFFLSFNLNLSLKMKAKKKKTKTKHELEIFFYWWTQYSKIVTGSSIYGYMKRKITWALARKTEKTPLAWGLNCSLVTLQTRTHDTWREWRGDKRAQAVFRHKAPSRDKDHRELVERKLWLHDLRSDAQRLTWMGFGFLSYRPCHKDIWASLPCLSKTLTKNLNEPKPWWLLGKQLILARTRRTCHILPGLSCFRLLWPWRSLSSVCELRLLVTMEQSDPGAAF